MSAVLVLVSITVLVTGAFVCATAGRRPLLANRLGGAAAVAGAIPAVLAGARALSSGGGPERLQLPWTLPFGSFHIAVDGLSAFFLIAVAVTCGLAAVYGVAYLSPSAVRGNPGFSWFFYNLLFAGMLVVVTARDGVLFLFAWEIMSLASFFLVMSDHGKEQVRQAGWTYLVASHLGTAFLFALFLLLGRQGATTDFDGFTVPPGTGAAGVLFLFAVVGFGTKAGFMPLHVWLPEAHPAAPAHVSAVMSGVMIKTGIYGLLRVVTLLGEPSTWPLWWGWTLLGIGALSGIGGVLSALAQHDLKRLLAYHSVENIGIICLGLGLWLLGTAAGSPAPAALGLLGALLHVWNHAIFKSLLFLGAGAVVRATGTGSIEQLGGLLRRMPRTGAAFLVGSAAICGLPPLNGFVSEFLVYLGAFSGIAHADRMQVAAACLVTVGALALIGGLAAACFAKVVGIVFLGEGRTAAAQQAQEVQTGMRMPMLALAVLCVLIGLLGPAAVRAVQAAAAGLLPAPDTLGTAGPDAAALLRPVSTAGAVLATLALALWALRRRLLARRSTEETGTWDCGYAAPTARMQYTASSFAWPILDMFRPLLRIRLDRRLPSGLFPREASLESHAEDVFLRCGYGPVFRSLARVAERLRRLQQGRNQLYVLYITLTLLILLLWKLGMVR